METKKDGVAEAEEMVRTFSDKYLPPRPHHLTAFPESKYPPPEDFWFTGRSARLQYMTNLSRADRGFLVTLPYYEIIDEPEVAQPVKTLVRPEAKKKMSFKEYANRKTKSNSPPTIADNVPCASASANAKQPAGLGITAVQEKSQEKTKTVMEQRPKDRTEPQSSAKKVDAQLERNGDSRNRPQPKQDNKTSSPLEQRKRQPEREEPLPPPKRMRTEGSSKEGQARDTKQGTTRDRDRDRDRDAVREREREREKERGRDRDTQSEVRTSREARPSTVTNGRPLLPNNNRDQPSANRPTQVNGARSRADSSTITTPRKRDRGDSFLKSSIPPLLSPLRLPTPTIPPLLSPLRLDNHELADSARKRPAGKAPTKGPLSQADNHSRSTSVSKIPRQSADSPRRIGNDGAADTPEKKTVQQKATSKQAKEKENQPEPTAPKRLPRIPPLLSPTLPPIVEAELARLTKQEASSKRSSLPNSSDASAITKNVKGSALSQDEQDGPHRRRSLVVTIKYRKVLKPRISQLLQLPSSGLKKAERAERSASVEQTPPSKKRPRPASEAAGEPVLKKSKLSTEQSVPTAKVTATAAPATPQKNHATATAMSRVLSNTSQANTPGDSTGHTPGLPDRPSTSSDTQIDPAITAKITALRNLSDQHMAMGSRLKKARDLIVRGSTVSPADEKRAAVMHLEMVVAYMIAFKAMDRWHLLARRCLHIQGWESLLAHFQEMRVRLRHMRSLDLLSIQLHGVVLEEITQSFATLDEKQAAGQHVRWARHARYQPKIWRDAQMMLEEGGVPDPKLRANIGAGSGVDDSVRAALTLLKRWADREGVNWKSEIEMPSISSASSLGVNGA